MITSILNRIQLQHNISKDKDIATWLKMTPGNIGNCRNRNRVPYKELITYCKKNKLSLDYIILGRGHAKHNI